MEYKKVPLTCDPLLQGYEIDTKGIVYGKKGKPLKVSTTHTGYSLIIFSLNGKSIGRSVHRLVALQFLPNPEQKPTVNHIDGNRSNNSLSNLEWATLSEQQRHSFDVLGEKQHNNKRICGKNIETGEVVYFESIADAGRTFSRRKCTFSLAVEGKKPSCAGYVWINDSGNREENEQQLNRKIQELTRHNSRKVGKYSLSGELVKIYDSAYATRLDGFCHQIVLKCCSKYPHYESQTHKGLIWRFLEHPLGNQS